MKTKSKLIVIALILLLKNAFAQAPVKQWDARFGGTNADYLEAMDQASDGGYILGGYSLSGIGGDKTQSKVGGEDYWMVKTDSAGVKQWDARFGGTEFDVLHAIKHTNDGGYILGGESDSDSSGDKSQDSQGQNDYWIVKTSANGIKQWDIRLGGKGNDYFRSLQQTTDGGYILGGTSLSGKGGDKSQKSQGSYDYWILKTDANGIKQWDARFGGINEDFFSCILQTADGGYLLGGTSWSGIGGDKTQAGQGENDYWVVKTNANGVKEWDARFGGDFIEYLTSAEQTTDGGYLLGGYSQSGISGDKSQASHGISDFWIVKINATGIKQWDARFGGSENDNLMSLQQISDGGYILAGRTSSEKSGDVSQESKGIEDYWIVKTDINGIKQWDARFGGSSYELLNAAEETEDDGFILGGSSPSPSGGDKSQNSQGDVDYWIIKVAAPLPPVTCYVPDGTFTSGINTTLATVNWNAVSSANKYKVRYRVAGTAGWITISAVKNYKTLNGLSAGNSYEWQVKSICKELDLGNSDWSPIQIFTTLPQKSTDAPLSEKEIFSVYPNPVSSSAVIEFFLSNTSALKIDLFDIQGRKIKTIDEGNFEAGNYQLHFERNNLPSGIYFLRLKADTHITTQKLIVQ